MDDYESTKKELKHEGRPWSNVEVNELCDRVRQIGFDLHRFLRSGYLEQIYERALHHRLSKAGIRAETQVATAVHDEDGFLLGEYHLDLVVEGVLIVELKAVRNIDDAHIAQLLGYLKSTHLNHGLLINFGSTKYQIRKFKF